MDNTAFLTLGLFLLLTGALLLLAELFITSGGVLMVLGLGGLIVGLVFLFRYDTWVGIYGLVGVLASGPLLLGMLFWLWPYTTISQMASTGQGEQAEDALAVPMDLQQFKGRYGKTITALRPAGMVDFDGRRIDSLTEGMMVEAGRWVRCIEVSGNRVIVRQVDKPNSLDLETASIN
jgi:membrane-bound ClpP family serine protease